MIVTNHHRCERTVKAAQPVEIKVPRIVQTTPKGRAWFVGFESVDSGGTYARRSATIFFATGGGEGERVSPTGVTSTFASG